MSSEHAPTDSSLQNCCILSLAAAGTAIDTQHIGACLRSIIASDASRHLLRYMTQDSALHILPKEEACYAAAEGKQPEACAELAEYPPALMQGMLCSAAAGLASAQERRIICMSRKHPGHSCTVCSRYNQVLYGQVSNTVTCIICPTAEGQY